MYYICNYDTLRLIYFAYFHSIVSYGIILGGNSSNSGKIFNLQKRIIRIMMGAHPRTSCRKLFKKLDMLTVPSQCIYWLMSFLIGSQEKFQMNSSVHSINTRNKHHFHRPVANLSCFQKSASFSGIRIFNNLPWSIISPKNEKTQFKVALKKFLYAHSFYSVDEFFAFTDDMYYWPIWLCKSLRCIIFLYVSMFMTYPVVLWQPQGSMECMYVKYVCMYVRVCMYVCMHVWAEKGIF
jgi:IS1 family transposase